MTLPPMAIAAGLRDVQVLYHDALAAAQRQPVPVLRVLVLARVEVRLAVHPDRPAAARPA